MATEEEFDPAPANGTAYKRERTRRIRAQVVQKVLSSDKKLNAAFDKQAEALVINQEPEHRLKPTIRKHGRPDGGRVTFEQARIDALPESGYAADVARALGIKRASLQQWCGLEKNPLPCIRRDGHTLLRKDVVVKWLIKTKRYVYKPEYSAA